VGADCGNKSHKVNVGTAEEGRRGREWKNGGVEAVIFKAVLLPVCGRLFCSAHAHTSGKSRADPSSSVSGSGPAVTNGEQRERCAPVVTDVRERGAELQREP
jgi:hypothetical protein